MSSPNSGDDGGDWVGTPASPGVLVSKPMTTIGAAITLERYRSQGVKPMISSETTASLRLADRSLRRYATHLGSQAVDEILYNTYVSAVRRNEPIIDGNRASIPLFRDVHSQTAAMSVIGEQGGGEEDGNDELGNAVRSLPIAARGALLLTSLERLTIAEAAQVLAVPDESVVELVGSATDEIRQGVPSLDSTDATSLGRALGDLPASQATPMFWQRVETATLQATSPLPAVPEPAIAEPELTPTTPPPPRESFWPAVWAGTGAVAVIALIIIFLVSRSGDDEIAADDTGPVGPTSSFPPSTGGATSTAVAPPESTTAPPTTAPPTTALPTTAPPTTAPPTAPTTTPPTTATSTTPPTTPPPSGGETDRGPLPLSGGLAIIDGSPDPGSADIWQVEVQSEQTLSMAIAGLGGLDLAVNRPDGSALSADYIDSGLLVFTEPGSHTIRIGNGGSTPSAYSVGVGLAGQSGFLTSIEGQGASVAALEMASCTAAPDRLDATLTRTSGADQQVIVVFTNGQDVDTVTGIGSAGDATGQIEATWSVPTGLIFTGTVTDGPDGLLGLPFQLGVYGCSQDP